VDHVLRGEAVREVRAALLLTGAPPAAAAGDAVGVAAQLYDRFPAFADALDEACLHLDAQLDAPAQGSVLAPRPGHGGVAAAAAGFAWEVALARLLQAMGVRVDAVRGHGLGEIAAAHLAGTLALPEAAALVIAAARLGGGGPDPDDAGERFRQVAEKCAPATPVTPLADAAGAALAVADLLLAEHWSAPAPGAPPEPGTGEEHLRLLVPARIGTLGGSAVDDVLTLVAGAHVRGVAIGWAAVLRAMGAEGTVLDLPTYAFQRAYYWLDANPVATFGETLAGKNLQSWRAVEGQELLDEQSRREVVEEYFRRLNAGDVEGTLAMFSPTIRMEDPVGGTPYVGIDEVREYVRSMLQSDTRVVPTGPLVAAQDGVHVAVPFYTEFDSPGGGDVRAHVDGVDTLLVNGEGKIEEIRVFWGMTDVRAASRP